jgi:hypothetical protein
MPTIKTIFYSKGFWLWIYLFTSWVLILISGINHRSYQDTWVLESIFIFFAVYVLAFLAATVKFVNSSYIALLVASFTIIIRWAIGLKYSWVYGTAIDQIFHPNNVEHIIETGITIPNSPYTDIPGLHAFVSVVALISKAPADDAVDYCLPILIGLIPLIIYNLCCAFGVENALRNQIVLSCALVFDPYTLSIQGSTFGSLLIFFAIVVFFTREAGDVDQRYFYTVLLLLITISLLFSHGISSLIFIPLLLLTTVTFCLLGNSRFLGTSSNRMTLLAIKHRTHQLAIFVMIFFISWWMYEAEGILQIFIQQIRVFLTEEGFLKTPIPNRIFQLDLKNALLTLWMLHGNTILLLFLSFMGVVIYVKIHKSLSPRFRTLFYGVITVMMGLVIILFAQLVTGFGNLEYMRLITYAITFCPFLIGLVLWRLKKINTIVWFSIYTLVMTLSLPQAFPFQPLVPKGNLLFTHIGEDEPVVYLHNVVTEYQESMLNFAHEYLKEQTQVKGDMVTTIEAAKFWGVDFLASHPIQRQYSALSALDSGKWQLLMLHLPGKSGPFFEPVEFRFRAEINRIIKEPGRSLIYNNGESYILMR